MRPALHLLGFVTAAAFWPGFLDATTVPRWAALALLVPLCLITLLSVSRLPALLLTCVGIAGASLFWAPAPYIGGDEFFKLLFIAGAFWLGMSLRDSRPLWEGIIAGVLISTAFAAMQATGFDALPQAAPPAGLFGNRNFLSDAAVVALIAAVALHFWVAAVLLFATILIAGSKAAFAALLVAGAAWFMTRRPALSWACLGILGAAAIYLFASGHESVAARLEIWEVALSGVVPFGNGIGSFAAAYPGYEYVHNEPLQLVYEFGVLSIPFFLLAFSALKGWSDEVELEAIVLLAVGAIACFSFPMHLPLTALAAAVAAGRLYGARNRVGVHDPAWGGGAVAHV